MPVDLGVRISSFSWITDRKLLAWSNERLSQSFASWL